MINQQRIVFLAPAATITPLFPQLKEAAIEVGLAENLKGVAPFLRKQGLSAIFSRPVLAGYSVEDLLAVGADDPNFPPVYIIAEKGSAEEAENLLTQGAKDYWTDPIQIEKILAVLRTPAKAKPVPHNTTLGNKQPAFIFPDSSMRIVGSNPLMMKVLSLAKQVAKSKASVLISGESGTGKEMFSRMLHAWSDRANAPFIAVNCAALPEHLLESELFGHEKGAFTGAIARKPGKFELANGGTLLLDEISEMAPALQAKLLRVLQEGEIDRVGGIETVKVDVRVLATTNRDMEKWIKEGKFRQDLYFRLNVIPLRLPSLAERGSDVMELADFFTKKYAKEYNLPQSSFSSEALEWLTSYSWPGNVRELQNLMERAVLLANGNPIMPAHFLLEGNDWPLFAEETVQEIDAALFPDRETQGEILSTNEKTSSNTSVFPDAVIPLHEMERIMILKGLEATSGNRTQAAELLGISVRTLRNKLSEYREMGMVIE